MLIVAALGLLSYRWYRGSRIGSTIVTVNVEGGTLTIRTLPGYCSEVTRDFITPLEREAILNGKVIAVSAPCSELTAFKTGKVARLQKYIVWFVGSTAGGSPLRLSPDTTRSDFADQMAQTMPKVDLAEVASEVEKSGFKIGIIEQGLIDRDVDAVYVGSILRRNDDGTVRIIPSVTGIAAIHHFVLSINAYDDFEGNAASLSDLLPSIKTLMRAALSDNSEN